MEKHLSPRRGPGFKVKLILTVVFLLVLSILACFFAFTYLNEAPNQAASTDSVFIKDGEVFMELFEGENDASVGRRLYEAGLIKNRDFWELFYSIDNRIEKKYLIAGIYKFQTGLKMLEIQKLFTTGQLNLIKVTVPEGSTIKKTARILEEAGVCPAEDFFKAAYDKELLEKYGIPGESMEGYLYPDTYLWTAHYPARLVVESMADNFFKTIAGIDADYKALSPRELYEKVILASIIEREYRIPEEAPVMAGVFYNRLKRGMRLESCASVEYIITEIEGKEHPARLFTTDTKIDNPYNTYLYRGLPPGPISSPGETALRAAFNPEKNNYYFFRILDAGAGRHYFSKTFDDHIKAGLLLVK